MEDLKPQKGAVKSCSVRNYGKSRNVSWVSAKDPSTDTIELASSVVEGSSKKENIVPSKTKKARTKKQKINSSSEHSRRPKLTDWNHYSLIITLIVLNVNHVNIKHIVITN